MEQKRTYRIIISGGGTGGHIFPAIAIASQFKARFSDAEVLFVGARGKMEMTKVPEAGYKIIGLPISGLQRKLTWKNLNIPFKVVRSLLQAKRIIREFKPDVAIGVGGYASAPLLRAASSMGIRCLIQEQNSYAGLTNKWLGQKVDKICVAYEKMERYFPGDKIVLTGNPVRTDVVQIENKKEKGLQFFNLKSSKKILFAMGGSLGARNINESILNGLQDMLDADIQIIWQVGKFYIDDIKKRLKGFDEKNLRMYEFMKEMDLAYAVADVVISRAGALSISELCLVKKPVIFVPSSNVAEDHQTKNAMALVERDAALIVPDDVAKDKLVKEALALINDGDRCQRLSDNIGKIGRPHATEDIVNEIVKLIE